MLTRSWKQVVVVAALYCATAGLTSAQDVQHIPSAASSSAPAKGSIFKRLQGGIHLPWHHDEKDVETTSQQASTQTEPPALYAGPDVRIVDITTTSNRADEVVDPTCKAIVKPFNVMSSTLSLATFVAKIKLSHLLGTSSGSGTHALIRSASMQLNWLPAGVERAIGARLLARDKDGILPKDGNRIARIAYQHADATLARVMAQIPGKVPYEFKIYVLKEGQGNASSFPSGEVLVDEDVVGRNWDPDLAFFKVAHEVSHILQRHQTHAYQAAMADGVDEVSQLRNLLVRVNQQSPSSVISELWSFKTLVINFSSQQELQADACAVRLMSTGYPDPKARASAFKDVIASFPSSVGNADSEMKPKDLVEIVKVIGNGIYERHPKSQERRENIVAVARNY